MTSALSSTTWQQEHHHNHREWNAGYREIHMSAKKEDTVEEAEEEEDEDEEEEEEDEEVLVEEDGSSMSSSPSIPDENINFDLVYALHTFVATVEGQASVVKGDALILMEDTNIYWWLVEVLKTREVGYIPAENIETPYERLARLNKHRNVEITSPMSDDQHQERPETLQPVRSAKAKQVSIATGAGAMQVIHYELESEDEGDETERDDDDTHEESDDHFEDAQQDLGVEELEQTQQTTVKPVESSIHAEPEEELRVFAGNIGQAPLFHTFQITTATTADELVKIASHRFGLQESIADDNSTIEHYLAVQGLDGDDYVLMAQDKPLSIFHTLTASLTTPMPSVTHIQQDTPSQQQQHQQKAGRRPRSSSFSNYEQTSYDEDSVIRFYLHRRIKRANEREGLIYIKVSLYPDESTQMSSQVATEAGQHASFTTNPTPASKKKSKLLASPRTEVDRIDKIMSVQQEHQVGAVINMALEKFHVPDAEAEGFANNHAHPLSADRCLAKYKMSVRANGIEMALDPREYMATALHSNQKHSTGPVTSDILFILRPASTVSRTSNRPVPPQLAPVHRGIADSQQQVGSPETMTSETRRPSILDILMDSPRSVDSRRPSFMTNGSNEERRPSNPTSISSRKSSLTPPHPLSVDAQCRPASPSSLAVPSPNGMRRTSVMSANNLTHSGSDPEWLDANGNTPPNMMARSNSLQPTPTHELEQQQQQSYQVRKNSGFKAQLKRLVGWGSKSKKAATIPGPQQPDQHPHQLNPSHPQHFGSQSYIHQNTSSISMQSSGAYYDPTPSQISVVSAPATPLTPSPSSPHKQSRAMSVPTIRNQPMTSQDHQPQEPLSSPITASPLTVAAPFQPPERTESVMSLSSEDTTDDEDEDVPDVELSDESSDEEDEEDEQDHSHHNKEKQPAHAQGSSSHIVPLEQTQEKSASAAGTASRSELNDIQAQYAMWMDSQPPEQPTSSTAAKPSSTASVLPAASAVPVTEESDISASPSSSSTASSSQQSAATTSSTSCSSTNKTDQTSPAKQQESEYYTPADDQLQRSGLVATQPKHQQTPQRQSLQMAHDVDNDLLLLVTCGVDYLKSRETGKWEDEGGYEFHPWNRPEGSFAVRKRQEEEAAKAKAEAEAAAVMGAEPAADSASKRAADAEGVNGADRSGSSLQETSQVDEEVSQEEKGQESLMSPLSAPSTPASITPTKIQAVPGPIAQKDQALQDDEFQRIVASHIVF